MIPIGTEVYYTGTNCNPSFFGVVREHRDYSLGVEAPDGSTKWLPNAMRCDCTAANMTHGSRLFLADDYRKRYEEAMESLAAELERSRAKRSAAPVNRCGPDCHAMMAHTDECQGAR